MKRLYLTLLFVLIGLKAISQDSYGDLNTYTDEELLEIIDSPNSNNDEIINFINAYLKRGKAQADTIIMARGYDRFARIYLDSTAIALKYTDSIIALTQNSKHMTYPSLAYSLKGYILENNNHYGLALENFIIAHKLSKSDLNKIYTKIESIGILARWGGAQVALSEGHQLLEHLNDLDFKIVRENSYRKTKAASQLDLDSDKSFYQIHTRDLIVLSLTYLGDYQRAFDLALKNYQKAKNLPTNFEVSKIYKRIGEMHYYLGNYRAAIDTIQKFSVYSQGNSSKLSDFFYLGASHYKLQNLEKGISYLYKADSLYEKGTYLQPEQRELFILLREYFQQIGNQKKEIEYLNKLIRVDSVFKNNYMEINPKFKDNFETPKLLEEKQVLIDQLEWENGREKRRSWLIACFLLLTASSSVYYFWKQKSYKKRFNALINEPVYNPERIAVPDRKPDISAQVVQQILEQLNVFEENHEYLSQQVSLQYVAKQFKTNSSYLSKVVNLKKDKNFSQYINELRVNYAINELKTNPRFRKYTIRAIAQEVGFGNAQSFSKAFYARTGIQPSYFVRNLNKHLA